VLVIIARCIHAIAIHNIHIITHAAYMMQNRTNRTTPFATLSYIVHLSSRQYDDDGSTTYIVVGESRKLWEQRPTIVEEEGKAKKAKIAFKPMWRSLLTNQAEYTIQYA
jgi:hypothetical protein